MSLYQSIRDAHANPETMAKAQTALAMVRSWSPTPRMPGADTITRLAHRIHCGMTTDEAAAAEYLYRWHLPLNQWVNFAQTDKPRSRSACRTMTGAWPVPHCIGL